MKIKHLLALAALAVGSSAWAQTDVTSTYLDNAGFDDGDFISTGVCTYAKDVAGNSADGSSLMAVPNWTAGASGDAKAGAAFEFGSNAFLTGTGFRVPSTNSDGNAEGGALGLGGCWDGDAFYTQNLKENLQPGTYTIEICGYNAGSATAFGTQTFGIKEAAGTTHYVTTTWTTGSWTTATLKFEIAAETAATFYLGATKVSGGSAASAKLFIDYVKIYKTKSLADLMDEATEADPVDVTSFYIQNAAVTGIDGWTNGRTNVNEQYTGAPDNTYLDAWNATFNMNQKVTLKAGKYTLKAATRAVSGISVANIYANVAGGSNNSTDITAVGNTDGELGRGWGWTTVDFLVMEDAQVTIGFYSECGSGKWAGADNFSLWYDRKIEESDFIPAAKAELQTAIDAIPVPTVNVGEGAFQYSSASLLPLENALATAQAVLDNDDATLAEVNEQIDAVKALALPALNAPTSGQRFHLNLKSKGTTTFVVNPSAQSGYSITFNATESNNYPQAFELTPVAGAAENDMYTISFTDTDGETRYICNGIPYSAGTGAYGIRTITDSEKALVVKVIATATEGEYNLLNTSTDGGYKKLGSNGGDFYTDDKYSTFTFSEASEISGPSISAAGYATYVAPVDAAVPTGAKAYTVTGVENDILVMAEVETTIPANTAVILEGSEVAGVGLGYAKVIPENATVTTGLLTGVYNSTLAPVDSYVLQNNNNKIGFYQVDGGAQPTVGANRCYLTVSSLIKAFFLDEIAEDDTPLAINGVAISTKDIKAIYNAAGQKVNSLQKGINIVKTADGKTQKLMVK